MTSAGNDIYTVNLKEDITESESDETSIFCGFPVYVSAEPMFVEHARVNKKYNASPRRSLFSVGDTFSFLWSDFEGVGSSVS